MGVLGGWGSEIVFSVSENRVMTFRDFNRSVSTEWAVHSRIGEKDRTEFLRPGLQKITFTMELNAEYGVKPRSTLEKLAGCAENGIANTLAIGGRRVGNNKWRITGLTEAWETVYSRGELTRAKVNVTMEEYV